MLYISPLLSLNKERRRFGYADDIAILTTGRNHERTAKVLARELEMCLQWGRENGIDFDPAKAELIHFWGNKVPDTQPSLQMGDTTLSPSKDIRWLGMRLDNRLSFKAHIDEWSGKAARTANFLRRINKTRKGAPPDAVAIAAKGCVLPLALYGAEAYFPGETRCSIRRPYQDVQTGYTGRINKIQRALQAAARAVIPVWKTTRISILHRESGIPPAVVALQQARHRYATRIAGMDSQHPVVRRTLPIQDINPSYRTRLQRTAELCRRCEHRPSLVPDVAPMAQGPNFINLGKEEAQKRHLEQLLTMPATAIAAYSDGSQLNGRTGWGAASFYKGKVQQSYGNMANAEVFDAEVKGANNALLLIRRTIRQNANISEAHLFLDNYSVVQGLTGGLPESSQQLFRDTRALAHTAGALVKVSWAPSHKGIIGNELADRLAKEGTTLPPPPPCAWPTLSYIHREARARQARLLAEYWEHNLPDYYQQWGLAFIPRPPELKLPRPTLHRLLAERSGHGDFQAYHDRFNHGVTVTCRCGQPKERGHFTECQESRHLLPPVPRDYNNIQAFLLGPKGSSAFHAFVAGARPYRTE